MKTHVGEESRLGNLSNSFLSPAEFWGSVRSQLNSSHLEYSITDFYFGSLLIVSHFLFPLKGLPVFVCFMSIRFKGFQFHAMQTLGVL